MSELHLLPGLVGGALCAVLGLLVPTMIGRVPEPDTGGEPESGPESGPESRPESGPDHEPAMPEEPEKEPYAAIAALPGLRVGAPITGAVVGLLLGLVLGWDWALVPLLPLVPIGTALAVVDWRTRLLPTRIIAPTYLLVGVLVLAGWAVTGSFADVLRALLGWAIAGGSFFVLWFVHPRGMGYGDVRLSGVLGIALGHVGWAHLLTGVYAGFLLGAVIGTALAMLRRVDRSGYPFGPFMLAGALVGALWGEPLAGLVV